MVIRITASNCVCECHVFNRYNVYKIVYMIIILAYEI